MTAKSMKKLCIECLTKILNFITISILTVDMMIAKKKEDKQ